MLSEVEYLHTHRVRFFALLRMTECGSNDNAELRTLYFWLRADG